MGESEPAVAGEGDRGSRRQRSSVVMEAASVFGLRTFSSRRCLTDSSTFAEPVHAGRHARDAVVEGARAVIANVNGCRVVACYSISNFLWPLRTSHLFPPTTAAQAESPEVRMAGT